ncbi:MAG: hypothetical protein JHC62_03150 [Microbacteriaceae bacterium]|nr:hypothetical protein [Microbacteriaceae bacterium]
MQTNLSALEAFLDLPIWLIALIVTIPIALVIALGTVLSARRTEDPESANFGREALAIVSGAFIFVGAFAVVTSWDNQTRFAASITNEFTSATSLAEDLGGIGDPRGKLVAEALVEYALAVEANEIGEMGTVGPTREAQVQLATIEADVVTIAETASLTDHQIDNVYTHLEALKDARKSRLTVQLPNLPITLILLLVASSLIALFGISLYPPSKIRWLKYFYTISAGLIVLLIVVNILALQSPRNISTQVQRPIDLFVNSVAEGGANLEMGEGNGEGEGIGEKPGAPQPSQPPAGKP